MVQRPKAQKAPEMTGCFKRSPAVPGSLLTGVKRLAALNGSGFGWRVKKTIRIFPYLIELY
jgi:hypothetical protein